MLHSAMAETHSKLGRKSSYPHTWHLKTKAKKSVDDKLPPWQKTELFFPSSENYMMMPVFPMLARESRSKTFYVLHSKK